MTPGKDYVVESRPVIGPRNWVPISDIYYRNDPYETLRHCENDHPAWKGKYEFRLRWLRPRTTISV